MRKTIARFVYRHLIGGDFRDRIDRYEYVAVSHAQKAAAANLKHANLPFAHIDE